jgi:hypothetical protein
MGADIIIATLAQERERSLDWDQVDHALEGMTLSQLNEGLDYATGDTYHDVAEARKEVRRIFAELKEIIEDFPRDLTTLHVRGLKLYVSGGMSWGDMPTDSSTVLDAAVHFDPVLKAVGFVTDWWEDPS